MLSAAEPISNNGSQEVKSWDFIRRLFHPSDPVAIVLINSRTGDIKQKVVSAKQASSQAYQRFLRGKNAEGYNVHLGMNPMYSQWAVRLVLPVVQPESMRNALESLPDLKDASHNAELAWKFEGNHPEQVQKETQAAARALDKALRNTNLQQFAITRKANRERTNQIVQVTVPGPTLQQVRDLLRSEGASANPREQQYFEWKFRALSIEAGREQAKALGERIDAHLAGTGLTCSIRVLHHRLKEDVREVRRLYLDLDHDGPKNLKRILDDARTHNLPLPNYVLTTSPNRYQAIWNLEAGLKQEQAEQMLRSLAYEYGGDPACCDVSRVLRVPGLQNKKYAQYIPVKGQCYSLSEYKISDFHCVNELAFKHANDERRQLGQSGADPFRERRSREASPASDTQSHRDWHFCCRAAELAVYRSPEAEAGANLEKTYMELRRHLAENCSDNHRDAGRYADTTVRALRRYMAAKIPTILQKRKSENGLDEAERQARQVAGENVRCYPANPQSGLYIGCFVGETSRHYLQQIAPRTIIAHRKQEFSNTLQPQSGRRYTVRYNNHTLSATTQIRHVRHESSRAR